MRRPRAGRQPMGPCASDPSPPRSSELRGLEFVHPVAAEFLSDAAFEKKVAVDKGKLSKQDKADIERCAGAAASGRTDRSRCRHRRRMQLAPDLGRARVLRPEDPEGHGEGEEHRRSRHPGDLGPRADPRAAGPALRPPEAREGGGQGERLHAAAARSSKATRSASRTSTSTHCRRRTRTRTTQERRHQRHGPERDRHQGRARGASALFEAPYDFGPSMLQVATGRGARRHRCALPLTRPPPTPRTSRRRHCREGPLQRPWPARVTGEERSSASPTCSAPSRCTWCSRPLSAPPTRSRRRRVGR